MASFLSRYQAGERIDVWTKLTQLGPAVRDPDVVDDARGVARETMRRARANIEILIPRLQELRYQFQYGSPFDPAPRGTAGNLKKLEKWMQGPVPLSLEAWWEQIGSVCFMGRHPQLNPMQGDALPDPLVFSPLEEALDTAEDWARDRKRAAKSPAPPPPIEDWRPQVEMWRNMMREQQFTDAEIEARLRPAIAAFEASDRNRASERAAIADPRFHFDFAPDELHKADISGATYDVALPDAGADCLLEGCSQKGTFVEYLRRSFAWGGFPGWERESARPERELAFLTRDLLPL